MSAGEQYFLMPMDCVRRAREAASPAEREQGFLACRAALLRFREARRLDGAAPALRQSLRKGRTEAGSDTEQWYARKLSDRIAATAASDSGVRASRVKMWGTSEPLARGAALGVLASPILRFMTKAELDAAGIPMVGHRATLTRRATHEGGWCTVDIQVFWARGEHSERRRVREIHLLWDEPDERLEVLSLPASHEVHFLEWAAARGSAAPVDPGSVLDAVRDWAEMFSLQSPYAAWRLTRWGRQRSAVTFLLSGETPRIPAVAAAWEMPGSGADTVTITALDCCSPDSVAAAFGKAIRRLHKGPPLSASRTALAMFVEERLRAPGGASRGKWPRLCKAWNLEAPRDWRYRDYRNLRRDYVEWIKRTRTVGR